MPFISWDTIRKNTASSSSIFMSVCEQRSNVKGHHNVKIMLGVTKTESTVAHLSPVIYVVTKIIEYTSL